MSTEAPVPDPNEEPPSASLRGTFVAVVLMACFFLLTWFGMLALVMERRG